MVTSIILVLITIVSTIYLIEWEKQEKGNMKCVKRAIYRIVMNIIPN